jgi:hypothetical protein
MKCLGKMCTSTAPYFMNVLCYVVHRASKQQNSLVIDACATDRPLRVPNISHRLAGASPLLYGRPAINNKFVLTVKKAERSRDRSSELRAHTMSFPGQYWDSTYNRPRLLP